MKSKALAAVLTLGFVIGTTQTAFSAVTPGTKCTKAGVTQLYKGKTFTCLKLGKKLYWSNGIIKAASPAPTPSSTPTPTPSPTLTVAPTIYPNTISDFAGKYVSDGVAFTFGKPANIDTADIDVYEIGAQYLTSASADVKLSSSYSTMDVIQKTSSTSLTVLFVTMTSLMNSYGITTKDRTIMFRVRAVSKSIKGEWSNGIYVTPSVYYATPAPTPSPTPTPSQTPDVLGLTVQGIWSGPDSKMSSSYGWQWAAVKVTNKSSRSIMPSSWFTTSFVSPQGVSVDSNLDSFPTLLPGASGWLASTIHNPDAVGNVFLSTSGTLKASAISLTELPTVSNVVFTPAGPGGVATATIKNNSNMFLYKATHTNVVFLNSAGIPVYAYWGTIGASIAPGATARVNLPAFLGENLSFTPSGFTSVEVSLGVWLCDADSSFANCRW